MQIAGVQSVYFTIIYSFAFFKQFQVVTNQRNNMSSQWRPLQPDTMPSNGSLSPLQFGQRPVSRQITKNPQVKILKISETRLKMGLSVIYFVKFM